MVVTAKYHREYWNKNKTKIQTRRKVTTRERRQRVQEEVYKLKRSPCLDCKQTFNPWVMQFDHRPTESKIREISNMISNRSLEAILQEIAKCDLVCANCHAERTYQRQQK